MPLVPKDEPHEKVQFLFETRGQQISAAAVLRYIPFRSHVTWGSTLKASGPGWFLGSKSEAPKPQVKTPSAPALAIFIDGLKASFRARKGK